MSAVTSSTDMAASVTSAIASLTISDSTTASTRTTVSASALAPQLSPSPTCDVDRIRGFDSFPQLSTSNGPVCAWNWPDRAVNFTQCCAPNQEVQYVDWCTMYCATGENGTTSSLSQCLGNVLGQSYIGIYGCTSAASSAIGSPNMVLAVGVMLFVTSRFWSH